jgi:hypothetical protein
MTAPVTDQQIQEARSALSAMMTNVGSHMDHTLQTRAQSLHANNTVINKQMKDLEDSTRGLKKETDKLERVALEAQRKLKEVGNVQNWAEVMEREFLILEETVRLADESEGEEDFGPCRVCGVPVEVEEMEDGEGDGGLLLWCRKCEGEFHWECVGLEAGSVGSEWLCAECDTGETYLGSVRKMVQAESGGVGAGMSSDVVENRDTNPTAASDGDVDMGGMENSDMEGKGRGDASK